MVYTEMNAPGMYANRNTVEKKFIAVGVTTKRSAEARKMGEKDTQSMPFRPFETTYKERMTNRRR